MKIHLYTKLNEALSDFDEIINIVKSDGDEIYITTESKRSFRELEKIKNIDNNIMYVINSLNSLGMNNAEIATELSWFIDNGQILVINEIPSTYEFGVMQPMNQAILSTILQSIINNSNIVSIAFKKSNVGRTTLPFPDNWDDLYVKWSNKEISSKEFIELSGLKKATFYNLLTEYKNTLASNEKYMKKYKII